MDIQNMNLVELKALAFDLFSQKGIIEQNLKIVSEQMAALGKQAMEIADEVIAEVPAGEPVNSESTETAEPIDKPE